MGADLARILVNLNGQFTGRRENHRACVLRATLGAAGAVEQAVEQCHQEGGGFAGTSLGLTGDVSAGQGQGQTHGLNRCAADEAGTLQTEQQVGVKFEAVETNVSQSFISH